MRKGLLLTLALFGLGVMLPIADSHAADCADASDQSTLNECAGMAYKKSDTELNTLYTDIKNRLSQQPDTAKQFVAAQRSWIDFRDAECNFSTFNAQGGSAHGMLVNMCRDGLTQTRIKELKVYLACEEGDLGCPVPPKN